MNTLFDIDDLPLFRSEADDFPWDDVPERFSVLALKLGEQLRTDPVQFFIVEAALAGFILSGSVHAHSLFSDNQPTLMNFILLDPDNHPGRNVLNIPVEALSGYLDKARLGGGCSVREARELEKTINARSRETSGGETRKLAHQLARLRLSMGPKWICTSASPRNMAWNLSQSYGQRLLLNGLGGGFISELLMSRVELSERIVRELFRAWGTGGCELSGQPGDSVAALWSATSQDLADWLAQVGRRMGRLPETIIFHRGKGAPLDIGPEHTREGWELEKDFWREFIEAMVDTVAVQPERRQARPLSGDATELLFDFFMEVATSQDMLPQEVGSIHMFVQTAERLATIFNEVAVGNDSISGDTAATAVRISRYLCRAHLECLQSLPRATAAGNRKSKAPVRDERALLLEKLRRANRPLTFRDICRKYNRPDTALLRRILEGLLAEGQIEKTQRGFRACRCVNG